MRVVVTLLAISSLFLNSICSASEEPKQVSDAQKKVTQQLPDHDITLYRLIQKDDRLYLTKPTAVANDIGYENQPAFSIDGKHIFYTKILGEQSDIWQWTIANRKSISLTNTKTSEFSAMEMPHLPGWISTVRVEDDGRQRLWRFRAVEEGTSIPPVLISKEAEPVGYYAWGDMPLENFDYGASIFGAFVLDKNQPIGHFDLFADNKFSSKENTFKQSNILQKLKPKEGFLASNIGRCIRFISPIDDNSALFTFTVVQNGRHVLMGYSIRRGRLHQIVKLPANTQDYSWLGNSLVVSGDEGLYFAKITPSRMNKVTWKAVKYSNKKLKSTSRIAISPDHQSIAVVHLK